MNEPITQQANAVIPSTTAREAVRLASAAARMQAYQLQARAAAKFLADLVKADSDWQAAQELKRQVKKSTAATLEEITALETAAKEKAAADNPDAAKTVYNAKREVKAARQTIERTIADSGQLFLQFGEGVGL